TELCMACRAHAAAVELGGGSGSRNPVDDLRERIAAGDQSAVLVAHLHVELQPVAALGAVLGADAGARRDRVAELGRLEPAGFQPPLVAAAWDQPVGERAGEQGEVLHAMHDHAAEAGLAEARLLHPVRIEVQRVVVERGVAEGLNGLGGHGKRPAGDDGADLDRVEALLRGFHGVPPHCGRIVQPRPVQTTSPRWLVKTLSWITKSRPFLMKRSSAVPRMWIVSPGRAGTL